MSQKLKKNTPPHDRFYTVMVIPEGESPLQWRLSHKRLKLFGIGGMICLGGCVVLTAYGLSLYHKVQTLQTVGGENKLLKGKLTELTHEVTQIHMRLEHIHTFSTKLRLMPSIETPSTQPVGQKDPLPPAPASGIIPASFQALKPQDTYPLLFSFHAHEKKDEPLQVLESHISSLWTRSIQQSEDIQALYELVQDQYTLLRSTPSLLPTRGEISSRFGFRADPFTRERAMHAGIDIHGRIGTHITAPADGRVTTSNHSPDYGNTVVIEHGYGLSTRYAHNQKNWVKVGQKVKRGDVIATLGTSGRSTGPHLHYEVRVHEVPVDPERFILDNHPILTTATLPLASSRQAIR